MPYQKRVSSSLDPLDPLVIVLDENGMVAVLHKVPHLKAEKKKFFSYAAYDRKFSRLIFYLHVSLDL